MTSLFRSPRFGFLGCFFRTEGGVFGADADAAKKSPEKWKVRQSLLYKWQTQNRFCPFRTFKRKEFCKLMNGRNLVVVGDSFARDLHDVLLNNVVTTLMRYTMEGLSDAW